MEIIIACIGAGVSIIIACIGAIWSNKNSIALQTRKLKEEHYIKYIQALHNLGADNQNNDIIKEYAYYRNKLFIIASESVVNAVLSYEEQGMGKEINKHNEYLTNMIKVIREDLKIKDTRFPMISFKFLKREKFNQ